MITHTTVLKALAQCTMRYRIRGRLTEADTRTHNWGLDKTCTIDMTDLLHHEKKYNNKKKKIYVGLQMRSYKYTQGASRDKGGGNNKTTIRECKWNPQKVWGE